MDKKKKVNEKKTQKNKSFKTKLLNVKKRLDSYRFELILIIVIIVLLTLFIYLDSFSNLVYNEEYYQEQYQINKVYDKFNDSIVDNVTDKLFEYFESRDTALIDEIFFSERDKLHLVDVKNLIIDTFRLYYYSMITTLFTIFLLYLYNKKKFVENVNKVLVYTGITVVMATLFLFLLRNNFTQYFYQFHQLVFKNQFWLLNPLHDKLISLFPQSFFFSMSKQIILFSLVKGIVLIAIGILVNKYKKQIQYYVNRGDRELIKNFKKIKHKIKDIKLENLKDKKFFSKDQGKKKKRRRKKEKNYKSDK